MAQVPVEVVGSSSLEVFQNHGDVALRDVVSGHGGGGVTVGIVIIVVFSNLNDSVILCILEDPRRNWFMSMAQSVL